jgi:protein O-GlcNAc transferase
LYDSIPLQTHDDYKELADSYITDLYSSLLRLADPSLDQLSLIQSERAASDGRIKIGFLSAFFFRHSVGRLLTTVIMNLNTSVFDVYIIAVNHDSTDTKKNDDLSAALKSFTQANSVDDRNHWVSLTGVVASSMVPKVRSLSLDILVFGDVYMDSHTAQLAMYRLAMHHQVAFWGHPFTSGSADTIDYFISSDLFEFTDCHANSSRRIDRYVLVN